MFESNVTGTENVLDAAIEAGVDRIVYVSTVNVFGNTKEQVVDEAYQRDEARASSRATTRRSTGRTRSRRTGSRRARRS